MTKNHLASRNGYLEIKTTYKIEILKEETLKLTLMKERNSKVRVKSNHLMK